MDRNRLSSTLLPSSPWVGAVHLGEKRAPQRPGPPGRSGPRVGGLLCKPQSLFSQPGSLGSWTHPPLDSIQEATAFLLALLGFSGFLKTQWPKRNRKEEGAELWRNVTVFQGLRSQEELGARAAGILEPFWSDSLLFQNVVPGESGILALSELISPSHLTFLLGVRGGRDSP